MAKHYQGHYPIQRGIIAKEVLYSKTTEDSSGCWIWQGAKIPQGYGVIVIKGKHYRTHRVAWVLENGEIPQGLCVCHICDNPPCCNPSHLFLGSHKDNAVDRSNKGRGGFGQRNGNAKLTDKQVVEIRTLYKGKYGQLKGLAVRYGVSTDQIRNIVRGTQRRLPVSLVQP